MSDWAHTRMGRDVLEHHIPEITRQLTRIADALEKQNEVAPRPKSISSTVEAFPLLYTNED